MSAYTLALEFFERTRDKSLTRGVFQGMARWMENNTYNKGKPWSFFEHEFQLEICTSEANKLCVIKPSQVGLTEVSARMALAFLAMHQGCTAIYVLPHIKQASKFAKARLDPIIDTSPRLSSLVKTAANSGELKMLGISALYMGGASTGSQAISIPSNLNLYDEFDFCNPDILSTYESRLAHNKDDGYRRLYSTPTIDGYGISKEFSVSSKARYFCKCDKCNTKSALSYFDDVVIPGFDYKFTDLDLEHVNDPRFRIEDAWLKCPKCGAKMDNAMRHPENREWVHENPDNVYKGYAVKTFDLIAYNPISKTLKKFRDYKSKQNFYNYGLGETFKSEFNQVDTDVVQSNIHGVAATSGDGCYMGVDVGKHVVHVTIAKRINGIVKVLNQFKIKAGERLVDDILKVTEDYGVLRLVIDASPDYHLCQLIVKSMESRANPCIYIESSDKSPGLFKIDDKTCNVKVGRTELFDMLVKEINTSKVHFTRCEGTDEVIKHFQGMKRVEGQLEEDGNAGKAYWRKINEDDHYLHSLAYVRLAIEIDAADESHYMLAPLGFSGVQSNKGADHTPLFGFANLLKQRSMR